MRGLSISSRWQRLREAMQQVAENLWVMRFPLRLMGAEIGRTVTIIRLRSGELVIHSTAPFAPGDVHAICKLGTPKWLLDATLFHDTCAEASRAMFPSSEYLAPEGFRVQHGSLGAPPQAWAEELEVLELRGMPKVREHVFFHGASKTLIVSDLVFNFERNATGWTRFVFRWGAGVREYPGMGRLYRLSIRDRAAFSQSISEMMQWDFERVIVGHGELIEGDAKATLAGALGIKAGGLGFSSR